MGKQSSPGHHLINYLTILSFFLNLQMNCETGGWINMIIEFSVKNFKSVKDSITLSFKAEKSDDLKDYYIIKVLKNYRLLKLWNLFLTT